MKTLIKNANIVNRFGSSTGNIIISDGIIENICHNVPEGNFNIFDACGGIAAPSFANAHTHVPMTLLRSYADGHNLQDWLFNYIFPIEDKLTGEDIYYGSMIGIMEMIASGTTLFADMYFMSEHIVKAAEECGIKALIARCLSDGNQFDDAAALYEKYNNTANGRIKVNMSAHAIYTTNESSLRKIFELACKYGVSIQIHISETETEVKESYEKYGKSPVRYLYDLGFFDVPCIAAHCVHLNNDDISLLKEKNVTAVYNPTSNLKLGSGFAPIEKLKKAGVNIAVGTDGASSNNNLNMLEEMHLASIITNGALKDSTAVTAADAFMWCTNAAALGFENTGTLEAGKAADIVVYDTHKPHFMPMHSPLSNLVYSANSGDIKYVFCDGSLLYNRGEFTTIDAERIYYGINKCKSRIFN